MTLNKQGKDELRALIEEQLKDVDIKERVYLDKELLESLIFDIYTEILSIIWGSNSGRKVQAKYIVWSGEILSKIDLSEISFDDVVWHRNYVPEEYFVKGSKNHYHGVKHIDLSNTNAKIDFTKSLDAKYYMPDESKALIISNCNFANVDLSNNTIDTNCVMKNCNFSNTKLKISLNDKHTIEMINCNMSGTNLSAYVVDETFFIDGGTIARNCDFTNAGLHVNMTSIPSDVRRARTKLINGLDFFSDEKLQELKNQIKGYEKNFDAEKTLLEQIQKGHLNGCYVNGIRILSSEEKQAVAQQKREEYENMKKELFDSVIGNIQEQVNQKKK